jgi:hypothetical protein
MKNTHYPAVLSTVLALAALDGRLSAQSDLREMVPLKDFVEHAKAASFDPTFPGSRVKDAAAFEEMRQHLLTMYQGVEVTHTFVLDSAHFDCVPAARQPSIRILGLGSIAEPPPQSLLPAAADMNSSVAESVTNPVSSWDSEKAVDEFGNSVGCDSDSIPMRRITIEDMTRFPTLHDFFAKGPDGFGQASGSGGAAAPAASAPSHKYSYMLQNVNNLGGSSTLNLWNPPVVNTATDHQMTLSQEWYTGGSGAARQTAEVGWQIQPAEFNTQNAVLFVFWTADNYASALCYNLSCGAFVQYPGTGVILGARLPNYSTYGGAQYDISAHYYLYQGNWFLAINGTWIGYYPVSIYKGGQLSKYAQTIMYGSESADSTGVVYPPEGSGEWPNLGFGKAAYQRNVFYYNLSGDAVWTTLTPEQPSKCYSTSQPLFSGSVGWGVYFYEGGPGGSGC